MNLTDVFQMYKSMFATENGMNFINDLFIGQHKNIRLHFGTNIIRFSVQGRIFLSLSQCKLYD